MKTHVKAVVMSAAEMNSKSGYASTALEVSLGGDVKQGIFVLVEMEKRPPSWFSPKCLIRALGQVQLDLSWLSKIFHKALLLCFSNGGMKQRKRQISQVSFTIVTHKRSNKLFEEWKVCSLAFAVRCGVEHTVQRLWMWLRMFILSEHIPRADAGPPGSDKLCSEQ